MNKIKRRILFLMMALTLVLTACGDSTDPSENDKGDSEVIQEENDDKMELPGKEEQDDVEMEEEEDLEDDQDLRDVKLYFLKFTDTDAYLVEESHRVEDASEIARVSLEALRDAKAQTEDAANPIHSSAKINSISIEDGLALVDFSKEIENNNVGSSGEMLELQAIVNTLTQFSTIDRVTFTVDGDEDIEGWLSHVGTPDAPLEEDMSLVK